jgi:hypothetical protein
MEGIRRNEEKDKGESERGGRKGLTVVVISIPPLIISEIK